MSKIERMIEQTLGWRDLYKSEKQRPEAFACVIRATALIDAYEAVGGDGSKWREKTGLLRYRQKGT